VFDKENVFIANLELRRVADGHGYFATVPPSMRWCRCAGAAFERVVNLEGHIAYDLALAAFADPLRSDIGDVALKDELGVVDQLIEGGGNNGGGSGAKRGEDQARTGREDNLFFS